MRKLASRRFPIRFKNDAWKTMQDNAQITLYTQHFVYDLSRFSCESTPLPAFVSRIYVTMHRQT